MVDDSWRSTARNLPSENGMTNGREIVRATKETKTFVIVRATRAKIVRVAFAV